MLIPRMFSRSQLFQCIKEHFPHRRRDLHCHSEYLTQTLEAASYATEVLPRLVPMLVERLVELDVELALQQRELEEGDTGDDEIFEVDVTVLASSPEARARGQKVRAAAGSARHLPQPVVRGRPVPKR